MAQRYNSKTCDLFGTRLYPSNFLSMQTANSLMKPFAIEARANSRTESPKIRNRQQRKKLPTRPRLSVFCSDKQLYVALVDDQNKKNIFYGSTLQKTVREEACSTIEAAALIGEELVKTCTDLNINEMSYDRNGFARGSKMQAFEIAISRHGLLPLVIINLHLVLWDPCKL